MSLFNYVKSQLSILELAREYTTLVKAGQYWRGRCPFHNEKTASFTISPHKEIFYCFGCNTGGDIVTLLAKKENCSPLEAIHLLIDRYQLTIPESVLATSSKKDVDDKKRYFLINELLAQWCHDILLKNASIKQYLHKRGINEQSTELFNIGYFPGGLEAINACLAFMRRNSILADDLLEAGILIKGKTVLYSPFEERIIFPIRDHLARYCGFGGRIFREQDTRAKYYNSRENVNFIKSSILFGLDQAKKAIQKSSSAFLVEGYIDCITMVQRGYHNTVATLGTACTIEHLTVLARYAQKLFVVYDGDRAGNEAIMRLTKLCWQVDMELYVICLPAGEDPASFLMTGASLDPLIQQAQDIFLFFIKTIGTDFASKPLAQKLSLTRQLLSLIGSIADPLKQSLLLDKASKTLHLPLQSLQQELERIRKTLTIPPHEPEIPHEKPSITLESGTPLLEKKIFSSIMNNMQLLNSSTRDYLFEHLHQPLSKLLRGLYDYYRTENSADFLSFFNTLDEKDKLLLSRLVTENEAVDSVEEFEQLIMQLQKKNWKTMVHSMKERVTKATAAGDHAQAEKLIKEFLALKNKYYSKVSDTE